MGQYFDIDDMNPGDSVVLLVSATNPDSDKWAKRTPVTVTRSADGFRYASPYGETVADMAVEPNPGHQGLNAHMAALTGVKWAFEHVTARDLIRREYRKIRRDVAATARSESARYPQSIYPERYGRRAAHALEQARRDVEAGRGASYVPAGIWSGRGGSDGRTFASHGESAMRWIERPESKGLRFIGLAHDAAPASCAYSHPAVDHTGHYLDEFGGETVAGVVYQLPARGGMVRYLAGYADPYNADRDGRGPACLSMRVFESEAPESAYDQPEALRDAARAADAIAESYADDQREYEAAREAGRAARELAGEALEAGREMIRHCRDARRLWTIRNGGGLATFGISESPRDLLRAAIEAAREAREEYRARLKAARDARRWNWRNAARLSETAGQAGDYNRYDSRDSGFADGWADA